MKFSRYAKDKIVAYAFDDQGAIGLRRSDGLGLLRTSEGIPRSVIDRPDVTAVAAILACITEDLDQEGCARLGVEVAP